MSLMLFLMTITFNLLNLVPGDLLGTGFADDVPVLALQDAGAGSLVADHTLEYLLQAALNRS